VSDGYVTVNVTKAGAYNPTPEHAEIVRQLNDLAASEFRRESDHIADLMRPRVESWRLALREYVNEIQKERERGQ
jgi:hypothetical protein